MKNKFSLTALMIVCQCFLGCTVVFASVRVKDINISSKLATIKETFELPGAVSDNGRIIIHIQDAHCNYEAQKNLSGVLEDLVKNYNLKLVLVEGGSGDVSLSFLRRFGDVKTREKIADRYLMRGKISGEEYLDIVSDYDLEIYGIDDEVLYDAQLAVFGKVDGIKEEGLNNLNAYSKVIKDLKTVMYGDDLRRLEDKRSKYDEKTISLTEYCQFLKEASQSKGINVDEYAPHLTVFSETADLEKIMDFQKAEAERNNFIRDLANLLDENQVKEFLSKSQEYKTGKITRVEYYSYLKTAADKKLDMASGYPNLNAYISYLTASKNINAQDLLKEVTAIEDKLKDASFTGEEQRKLDEISRAVQILTRLLNLELNLEDYSYFKRNKDKFLTASWVNFLSGSCLKYTVGSQLSASRILDENSDQMESFYKLGLDREQAFIENVVKKMEESGEKIAVLITGGFHTPGVTRMLKEKGYSYIVATPVITKESDSSVYLSVLRGENSPDKNTLITEE